MLRKQTRFKSIPETACQPSRDVSLHTETLLSLEKDDKPSGGDPESEGLRPSPDSTTPSCELGWLQWLSLLYTSQLPCL